MHTSEIRRRFTAARVARLATVGPAGRPHLVPITFALLDDDTIVTAVDHKPKRTVELRRLGNIASNSAVAVLVDSYADDWAQLWWARADGSARVVPADAEPRLRGEPLAALADRYPQYRDIAPAGAIIVITVQRWSAWAATVEDG